MSISNVGQYFGFSDPEVIYIFPVPPMLNCSGNVVGARYCYAYDNDIDFESNDEILIFTLLILKQDLLNWPRFEVMDTYNVYSKPIFGDNCVIQPFIDHDVLYCCDVLRLDQFQLPRSNFAFGMADAKLLINFHDQDGGFEGFEVEHYRVEVRRPSQPPPMVGTIYSPLMVGNLRNNDTLRIFQFIIGKLICGVRIFMWCV